MGNNGAFFVRRIYRILEVVHLPGWCASWWIRVLVIAKKCTLRAKASLTKFQNSNSALIINIISYVY